jgi:phosphoribosylformylglycinamidine synthase subunit PurL
VTKPELVSYAAEQLAVAGAGDEELQRLARREALALSPVELRAIAERIGRNPTRAEAHAFSIQWSEHCSYKSSRPLLKKLPTKSADVLVGIGEDAGILRAATIDGVEYGVVVAHESHNHPSQVVPFEGAATGVGGILRDVLCMGAEVVASADPLRFGPPHPGSHAAYVAAAAVDGISAYGNAVGVPNLAGDVYFHESFTDNCLVNVVALGTLRVDSIIHSRVPPDGDGYDLVLVGKATDASGFGGAAFASLVLDATLAQANKSAVQVPDPFLKSVIMRASYAVFEEIRQRKLRVGYKDLGAGGIMGSSCELASAGGFGAVIDIDKVPVALSGLPPFVVACAETQERMLWAVPPSFTPTLLKLYNDQFTLPDVSANAGAAVIGKVTKEKRYVVRAAGETVMDLPIDVLTGAIVAPRTQLPPDEPLRPTVISVSTLANKLELVLGHWDVCSRRPLIERYDRFVRGATVIPSGYADAGVFIIKRGARAGLALSVDGNPRYGAISPRLAAAHAVVEAARNVAAVGAQPIGLTDCLNYGNPEDPHAYWQLAQGVDGLADAANALQLNAPGEPLPFVSGNVSLYNESADGGTIAPSAIVACIGRVDDVSRVVTMQLTGEGRSLFLFGARTDKMGGSVLYGGRVRRGADNSIIRTRPDELPPLDYAEAIASIKAVVAGIRAGVISAAHDISDGGLLACVSEMCLGGDGDGKIGAQLLAPLEWAPGIMTDAALFGETPGFVVEVGREHMARFEEICKTTNARPMRIGTTGGSRIAVEDSDCDVALTEAAAAWMRPLQELYA